MITLLKNSHLRTEILQNIIIELQNIFYILSEGFQFYHNIINIYCLINEMSEQRKLIEEFIQLTNFLLKIEENHFNLLEKHVDHINNYIGFTVLAQQNIQLEMIHLRQSSKIPVRSIVVAYEHDSKIQIFVDSLRQKINYLLLHSNDLSEISKSIWTDNIEMCYVLQIMSNERWDILIESFILMSEQKEFIAILNQILSEYN